MILKAGTRVFQSGFQRMFSQNTGRGTESGSSLVSQLAKNALGQQLSCRFNSSKKTVFDKKAPMSYEKYVESNMPSFDDFCQEVALPTIRESEVGPQRTKELSDPANLQRAYESYCRGSYSGYLDSLDPMNPFIL